MLPCSVCQNKVKFFVAGALDPETNIWYFLCERCETAGEKLPDFDIEDAPTEITSYNQKLFTVDSDSDDTDEDDYLR